MAATQIINNEKMELWFHPAHKIVHHKIKENLPNGAFKELLSAGADYMEKHGATKWLSDDSDVFIITKEDHEWAVSVWEPRVVKAGFKYLAVVKPTSTLGSRQLKRFAEERRKKDISVEIFDTVEAALAWLESV